MFLGVFYAVLPDPLAAGTVTSKAVEHMEHFLKRFEIFPKASMKYSIYVSIDVKRVNSP
jgi:hypothetical protein